MQGGGNEVIAFKHWTIDSPGMWFLKDFWNKGKLRPYYCPIHTLPDGRFQETGKGGKKPSQAGDLTALNRERWEQWGLNSGEERAEQRRSLRDLERGPCPVLGWVWACMHTSKVELLQTGKHRTNIPKVTQDREESVFLNPRGESVKIQGVLSRVFRRVSP